VEENHYTWIETIRRKTMERGDGEEKYLPSTDALRLHWLRTCWTVSVYDNSVYNFIPFGDVNEFGWSVTDNELSVVWDSSENISTVSNRCTLFTSGCTCQAGKESGERCGFARCGCKRKGRPCGPGCSCKGKCKNSPTDPSVESIEDIIQQLSSGQFSIQPLPNTINNQDIQPGPSNTTSVTPDSDVDDVEEASRQFEDDLYSCFFFDDS